MAIPTITWFATTVKGTFGVNADGIVATIVRADLAFVYIWMLITILVKMHLEWILRRTVCDNKDILCTKGYGMRTTAKVWHDALAQPINALLCVSFSDRKSNQTSVIRLPLLLHFTAFLVEVRTKLPTIRTVQAWWRLGLRAPLVTGRNYSLIKYIFL